MSQSLITIGTYWDVVEARLAKIHLEAAGIRSVLQNENSVSVNWLEFANVSKGVQLQVGAADVDAALEVLEQKSPAVDEIGDEWNTHEESVEDEDDEEHHEPETHSVPLESANTEEKYAPLNPREKRIRRGYLTANIGLMFLPLEFYSTYLLGVSLLSKEPLRPAIRQQARLAFLMNGSVLLAYFLFAWQSSQYGYDPFSAIFYTLFGE